MTECFGDFIEPRSDDVEYLIVGFSSASLPLKQRWKNKGLSADFIAGYLQTFFVGRKNQDKTLLNGETIPAHSRNATKYIANELLENAMKFSDESAKYSTRISFYLHEDNLIFYVTNSISDDNKEKFQNYIRKLLANDANTLYIEQMEANALDPDSTASGLGFLSMMCDYSAKLAWKFGILRGDNDEGFVSTVTTMVCVEV